MFLNFFYELKKAKVPVSLKEYLTLMEAMQANIAEYKVENFYYLSRSCLVKDERNLDKFDRVFGTVFKGLEPSDEVDAAEIPEEWLRKMAELYLTEEEKARVAYARNKRKQEYLAAKKRQEKFAAMMDPANDAGSVLVMETRRHTRECDARRRDAREEAARKRREQRDAFRAATAKQRAFVEEVERKETERIQKTLADYKDRALEAAKRAEEAAKRARKMRRESGTLVKRKKKKKPSGNEEAGKGAAAPSEK